MADPKARVRIVGENELGAAFKGALRDADGFTKKLQGTFKTVLGTLGIGAIGATIGSAVKQAVDRADELGTLAQAFGTTAEEISRLEYVASQTNTTLQQITTGLTGLQKRMSEAAAGTGEARKAIADLGVNASYLMKLPLNQQLEVLADAFGKIKTPADQVRIASKLFGDEVGRRLLPILQRGSTGLREMARESDALGNTLSTQTVEKLQKADEATKRFEAATRGLKTEVAIGLTPALIGAADAARDLLEVFNSGRGGRIEESIQQLDGWKGKLLEIVGLGDQVAATRLKLQMQLNELQSRGPQNSRRNALSPIVETAEVAETRVETLKESVRELYQFQAELMNRYPKPFESATDEANAAAIEDYFKKVEDGGIEMKTKFFATLDEMTVFAEQAGRSMQTALADFLFDPFKDGLDGMLKGFVDVIRRMIAEAAAARLLGGASGFLGGLLGGIFGGLGGGGGGGGGSGFFKAAGGPVSGGRPYIVGERGPELFVPGSSGSIVPNGKLASSSPVVNIVTNIDARGATTDLLSILPGVLRQRDEALEARIVSGLRRGAYAR